MGDRSMSERKNTIPFKIRLWCKLAFFGIAALWFYGWDQRWDMAQMAPFVYMLGNLFAETFLYRILKMRESRFCDQKLLRKYFKLMPKQLDSAALKTNKLKLLFLAGSTGVGLIFVGLLNEGTAPLAWALLANGFLGLSLLQVIFYKTIKMPYLDLSAPSSSSTDSFTCSNIEHINRSQGYGTIGGYIMSTRRD